MEAARLRQQGILHRQERETISDVPKFCIYNSMYFFKDQGVGVPVPVNVRAQQVWDKWECWLFSISRLTKTG